MVATMATSGQIPDRNQTDHQESGTAFSEGGAAGRSDHSVGRRGRRKVKPVKGLTEVVCRSCARVSHRLVRSVVCVHAFRHALLRADRTNSRAWTFPSAPALGSLLARNCKGLWWRRDRGRAFAVSFPGRRRDLRTRRTRGPWSRRRNRCGHVRLCG